MPRMLPRTVMAVASFRRQSRGLGVARDVPAMVAITRCRKVRQAIQYHAADQANTQLGTNELRFTITLCQ